jgi:hypothetical protein
VIIKGWRRLSLDRITRIWIKAAAMFVLTLIAMVLLPLIIVGFTDLRGVAVAAAIGLSIFAALVLPGIAMKRFPLDEMIADKLAMDEAIESDEEKVELVASSPPSGLRNAVTKSGQWLKQSAQHATDVSVKLVSMDPSYQQTAAVISQFTPVRKRRAENGNGAEPDSTTVAPAPYQATTRTRQGQKTAQPESSSSREAVVDTTPSVSPETEWAIDPDHPVIARIPSELYKKRRKLSSKLKKDQDLNAAVFGELVTIHFHHRPMTSMKDLVKKTTERFKHLRRTYPQRYVKLVRRGRELMQKAELHWGDTDWAKDRDGR